ncbi:TonB-dependent receptor [Roseateles sp. DAIF2]|nr:TonB-dependent receptor [Roseateles sp. DAIF2]
MKVRRDISGALVLFTETPAPPEEAQAEERNTLGTVVVSASRRREPVREVPMQVNIVSTDHLERSGAKTLQDYLGNQAGVDAQGSGGAGISSLSIRGVSTGTQTIATVGVYIDEVAFGSSTAVANGAQMALDMGLLDLKHIELLRGPQGTLYGASAMGGLLKYVTNEPDTYEFSGKAALSASTTRGGGTGRTLSAVVNVPLQEDVAGLRISAFRDHAGGFADTVGPAAGRDVDRGDTTGLRASVLLQPNNRFKARLTGTAQTIRRDGMNFVDYDAATGRPIEGDTLRRLHVPEPYSIKIRLVAADLEYDFGWARLNSISSRQHLRSNIPTDMSPVYVPLAAGLGLNLRGAVGNVAVSLEKTTQELRLTSRPDKQLEWLAGLYINRESSVNRQQVATTLADGTPGPELLVAGIPGSYREVALYGDLTWKFANGLSLTGGLRSARNKQHYVQQSDGLLAGGAQAIDAESSDTSRTWLLTARYALTPASSVYVRGASGYRPGGPNAVLRDLNTGEPTAPPAFRPDTLVSYEAGYKADLLDKRFSIEAAVFRLDWKDLQQLQPINGLSVVTNAGSARVNGAELVLNYRPDRHWSFGGNAALIDAKLSEDAPGLNAPAGTRLPNSARFSASLQASYAFSLSGHASYLSLAQRYVGRRNGGLDGSAAVPPYWMPSYTLTDLQAGMDFKRASLSLFVRNLFDKRAQVSSGNLLQALGGPVWVNLAQPRTLGATVTVPF